MKFKIPKALQVTMASLLTVSMLAACGGGGTAGTQSAPTTNQETTASEPAKEDDAAGTDTAEGGASAASEITYKGEISFYPQAYNPVEPTEAQPNPPTKFKEVAAAYEALHPDIKIAFTETPPDGTDYVAYIKTKISGGMAPDIIWAQYGDLRGGTYPKGAFTDLNPYLEMPNPYVEGNTKWRDLFKDSILNQIADVNGEQWVIDGDYVSTAVIYNKKMFEDAGITATPKNWEEFMDVCQKLVDSGVTPMAYPFGNDADSKDRVTWLSRLFLTNYYGEDFDTLSTMKSSTTNLSQGEVAIAFKNGHYGASDPRWIGWWEQIKNMIPYLPKDYLSAAQTPKTVFTLFVNENIAMYFDGSWAGNDLKAANCSFEWASFPFPTPIQGKDQYATNIMSSNAVGGPSAAFQYCVATQQANSSFTDEKMAAVIDFMMFITTPENNSAVVNEVGSFVPIVQGAAPNPGMEELVAALDSQAIILEGGTTLLGSNFLDVYYRTFQEYMSNKITLEEAAASLQVEADKEVDKIISSSDVDLTPYITQ